MKQILYLGAVAEDSIVFSYEHLYCRTLPIKFYMDFNSDCVFDAGDNYNMEPVTVAIDSNGITIDSMTVTTGLYRPVSGPVGTVYAFRVTAVSGGRAVTCPATAIIYDTITSAYTYPAKYFGISCGTSAAFDLVEYVSLSTTTTWANGTIYINNAYCTPVSPVVTMNMSPKYLFVSAVPAPASVVGNTITWNLSPLSSSGIPATSISFQMYHTATLTMGDTVNSNYIVTPYTGDADTTSNYIALVNTITASYDPNSMQVSPAGSVIPCQQLQYTVNFENTGNDTAHNIYVLDTLSPNLDASSLNVVAASAFMNITVLNDGTNNIARFDFPNIKLLDSSHHNLCNGSFIFSIKTKHPLVDGTNINNRASIYFDDNAPVETNTVSNVIGMNPITGANDICLGLEIVLSDISAAGVWSSSSSSATVSGGVVTGMALGTATISYTISNSCGSRAATKTVTVDFAATTAPITGTTGACVGSTILLSDATPGGTWSSSDVGTATVGTTGHVTAVSTGTATISYQEANSCGTSAAITVITVDPLPAAGTIAGITTAMCAGDTIALSASAPGGAWSSGGAGIATAGTSGSVIGVSAGSTVISYSVSNSCGTAIATYAVTVDPLPDPGTITGLSSYVCAGASIALSNLTAGGVWSTDAGGAATVGSTGTVSGISAGLSVISYTVSNSCGNTSATYPITVNSQVTPSLSIIVSPGDTVCAGSAATFTATPTNGGTSPSYQWKVNGSVTGGTGNTYTYTPADNDVVNSTLTSNAVCATTDTSSSSVTVNVDVSIIPIVVIIETQGVITSFGQSDTLTAFVTNGGAAPTFQWYKNGTAIPGATADTLVRNDFAVNDSISCVVTSSGTCALESFNSVKIYTISTGVGIISTIDGNIRLIPNPNNGTFSIRGKWGNDEAVQVEITDMLGQVVYKNATTTRSGILEAQISLGRELANGIYLLNIHGEGGSRIFHFILEQ